MMNESYQDAETSRPAANGVAVAVAAAASLGSQHPQPIGSYQLLQRKGDKWLYRGGCPKFADGAKPELERSVDWYRNTKAKRGYAVLEILEPSGSLAISGRGSASLTAAALSDPELRRDIAAGHQRCVAGLQMQISEPQEAA